MDDHTLDAVLNDHRSRIAFGPDAVHADRFVLSLCVFEEPREYAPLSGIERVVRDESVVEPNFSDDRAAIGIVLKPGERVREPLSFGG